MSADPFELALPPRPEHLGTARSFAAALARGFGASGETIEDLKLAVSEACTDALLGGQAIRLLALVRDRVLRFEVDLSGSPSTAEGLGDLEAPARIDLVRTLFPDAAIDVAPTRRWIAFSVSLP